MVLPALSSGSFIAVTNIKKEEQKRFVQELYGRFARMIAIAAQLFT